MFRSPSPTIKLIVQILLVSSLYVLSAKIVAPLSLVESGSVFAIWPPTGIALASLYLFGNRIFPGIFLGAFAINMTLTPFFPSFLIAITNTLGPVIGFLFLKKYANINIFTDLKSMLTFFLSIFFASIITATGGTTSLLVNGYLSEAVYVSIWSGWFLGDLIGFLLVTPVVISIYTKQTSIKRLLSIEGFFMVSTLLVTSLIFFGPFSFFDLLEFPLVYFMLPPLIWSALRFGHCISSFAILYITIASIYGTVLGYGAFIRNDPNHSLLLLQGFILMLAITILLIVAIFKEKEKANAQLKKSEQDLLHKVQEGIEKNKLQTQHMIQQSRLAQMGELISMIAHQWRQPLAAISATSIDLQVKLGLETFDFDKKKSRDEFIKYLNKCIKNIDLFVGNLSTTIDDFRNFYKPNKELVYTKFDTVIINTVNIIKSSLESQGVTLVYDFHSTIELKLFDNEMMQVILNILKNAQDNFLEKETLNPTIEIKTKDKSIYICDNGGGIPEDIIEKIFDPYFSTKDQKNGTGLGLYMSKMIIEDHHKGVLSVQNTKDGACFTIELN